MVTSSTRCNHDELTLVYEPAIALRSPFSLDAHEEINPGHGRKRVIEPRAAKYQLVATI
jgi:hypothetical protein